MNSSLSLKMFHLLACMEHQNFDVLQSTVQTTLDPFEFYCLDQTKQRLFFKMKSVSYIWNHM